MTTHDRVRKDLADHLNRIISLSRDVGASYETALHRIEHGDFRALLKSQEGELGGHIEALGVRVRELGAEPTHRGDTHRILDQARVVLGDVVGDSGILSALKSNLQELRDSLHAALASEGFVKEDRDVLERGVVDVDRHIRQLDELAPKL
jgi:hypothetical protein